ncbi:hypothetical protein FGIG_00528 [Fasciola gigantica]|uniref:RRM domain-containing protein n=1 Tax=Fasciola gigantica TaxID=46835 RepID=A0A504YJ06_FASGI|nr:hypothetical protein FGIG_00528 [Fasciola gigantica]
MHQMYKKACELYDKAVEKIKSSGLNLPTSLLPRPPAPFTHLTIGNTINPGQRSTGAPGAIGATPISGLLLPPPPPLISPSQTSTGTGASPRPSDPKLPLIPPTPGAFSSDPAYKAAYASAYQQTMKAIPTPQAGGPTPDTPEFAATWQRYMDHYLRYYLRTNALSAPNTKEKEQQLQHQSKQQQQPQKSPQQQSQHPPASEKGSDLAPKKDETLLPTTLPGNQTAESTVGLMPSNVADIALPPSPKRPRSTETTCATAAEQQTAKPLTADTAKDNQGVSPQAKQGLGQSETNKTGKTDESADLNESKYVWMSNLPQGVKAVDIKDRCTPFGRVQTIKIIGSRKSKPPSIYAYLIMETAEAAGRLIEGLQGTCFGNNQVKLKRITALPIP